MNYPFRSAIELGQLLASHNVIDEQSVYDPEGFDNYKTLDRLSNLIESLEKRDSE